METPDYNHIFKIKIYRENVYEPSEDTFILLDAMEKDVDSITLYNLITKYFLYPWKVTTNLKIGSFFYNSWRQYNHKIISFLTEKTNYRMAKYR